MVWQTNISHRKTVPGNRITVMPRYQLSPTNRRKKHNDLYLSEKKFPEEEKTCLTNSALKTKPDIELVMSKPYVTVFCQKKRFFFISYKPCPFFDE